MKVECLCLYWSHFVRAKWEKKFIGIWFFVWCHYSLFQNCTEDEYQVISAYNYIYPIFQWSQLWTLLYLVLDPRLSFICHFVFPVFVPLFFLSWFIPVVHKEKNVMFGFICFHNPLPLEFSSYFLNAPSPLVVL